MFHGSITALVTPMTPEGDIDFAAFEHFIDWQISEGTHGIVPVGTTGESPTLSHSEHKDLISRAVEVSAGRVPVIAGTGSNATREAIQMTQHAEKAGADAALIVTPYYNKPGQAGIYEHFKAVHDATNIPIILYNIPGRSVVDIQVDTMAELAQLPRIVGVKDATGDLARASLQRQKCGPDFTQLSGEDMTALAFNAAGGRGCISVISNVAPRLAADLQNACAVADYKAALAVQDKLVSLHRALFVESNPAPAKFACSHLGLMTDHVRLPLTPVSRATRALVLAAMSEAGLLEQAQG